MSRSKLPFKNNTLCVICSRGCSPFPSSCEPAFDDRTRRAHAARWLRCIPVGRPGGSCAWRSDLGLDTAASFPMGLRWDRDRRRCVPDYTVSRSPGIGISRWRVPRPQRQAPRAGHRRADLLPPPVDAPTLRGPPKEHSIQDPNRPDPAITSESSALPGLSACFFGRASPIPHSALVL